jgi:hypothetical protein
VVLAELSGCVGRLFCGFRRGLETGVADIVDVAGGDCVKTIDTSESWRHRNSAMYSPDA